MWNTITSHRPRQHPLRIDQRYHFRTQHSLQTRQGEIRHLNRTTQDWHTAGGVVNPPALCAPPFDKGGQGGFCQRCKHMCTNVLCSDLVEVTLLHRYVGLFEKTPQTAVYAVVAVQDVAVKRCTPWTGTSDRHAARRPRKRALAVWAWTTSGRSRRISRQSCITATALNSRGHRPNSPTIRGIISDRTPRASPESSIEHSPKPLIYYSLTLK